jgi:maltose alpha-D-glucosyltransferase/alpha-amylase
MTRPPTIPVENALTAERLDQLLPEIAARALAPYIASQRWYGDKARQIRSIALTVGSVVPDEDALLALQIIEISFADGVAAEYFVPLVVSTDENAERSAIAEIAALDGPWFVVDAVPTPRFQRWLLESLARQRADASGMLRWSATSVAAEALPAARHAQSRVSAAEQSNSSIVYGRSIILKVFRRLSPGINPEVELGRFLTTRTSFRHMPLLLGEWTYHSAGAEPRSLAVAQSFVANVGDGWSHLLQTLRTPATATAEDARRLGELTAQLHLALESARGDPDLAPEPIQPEDIAAWTAGLIASIDSTARALSAVASRETGDTRDLIDAFLNLTPQLSAQASGFERLIGRAKIRVHGDYHLGQTLRTTGGDFVILDFEGEPQRSIVERRAKTSPLKDVAGMLRSFSYARGAAERQFGDVGLPSGVDRTPLIAWERSARRAFLDSYIAASRRGGAGYLPPSDDEVRQALAAWELDKALYEVRYELNNRPDWLALPLAATLKLT